MKRLFNTENLIVAAVIFVAIFFAKFPTLYHWLNTPKGYWFPKNTSFYNAWDTNFQVSYLRYSQRHGLNLENTYTTEPHKGVFIYQYYSLLGIVNRFLHLDPFVLFHLATIITSIGLILVCYLIARNFFEDKIIRLAAFITAVLGGGFGWIPFLSFAADLNYDGVTLVDAFERGHTALSTILILLSFLFLYRFFTTNHKRYIFFAILASIGEITFHPPLILLFLSVGIILLVQQYITKKSLSLIFYPISILVYFGIYYLLALAGLINNKGFAGLVDQNIVNFDTISLALGFGILSFFIFWSLIFSKEKEKGLQFACLFFLSQLFFALSSFGFHRYFVKGMNIWGIILGFYGIKSLISSQKVQNIIITIVVAFSLLTRLYTFSQLMENKVDNPFFFLTKSEGDALSFMSTLPADKAALSLYRIGNYIPAHTDLKVYYGHKYQTPESGETLRKAQIFYTSMNEEEQRKFLANNHIDYIYYGWEEANLRKDNKLDPINPFSYFKVLFSNDAAIIYSASISAKLK